MNTATLERLEVVACDGRPVPADGPEHNPVEEWVTVIPDGKVSSSTGEFLMDQTAADQVIANHEQGGVDIVVDYEHQTLGEEYGRRDGMAPAAGWAKKLRYKAGTGLQAFIKWVPGAAHQIMDGLYRYLSPVVLLDKVTRRAVKLHSVALTNTPAIRGFPPIKPFKLLANSERLVLQDGTAEPTPTAQGLETLIADIQTLLGLPDDATAEQVLAAVIEVLKSGKRAQSQVSENVVKALGPLIAVNKDTVTEAEVVTAIEQLRESNIAPSEHLALRERVMRTEAEQLIERVGRQGKLTTSMAQHQLAVMTADVDRFEERKAEFIAMSKLMPVVVPMGKTTPPADAPDSSRSTVIAKAINDFDTHAEYEKVTNRIEWINLGLHEAGLELLTGDERTQYGKHRHA